MISALGAYDDVRGWERDPDSQGFPEHATLPDEGDYICGGSGPDGGDASVVGLWGGYGRDRIAGGGGEDSLYGGIGNDVLEGGSGADFIHGEGGHDRLFGGGTHEPYSNLLDGGPGDDYLEGRLGTEDSFWGGSGYDTCVMGPEDGTFRDPCEEVIPA